MRVLPSRRKIALVLILALLPAMTGCGKATSGHLDVGVLSATTTSTTTATGIDSIAKEQNSGYAQAQIAKDNQLILDYALEDDPQTEIQVLIRNLAQDNANPVVAILGGTSNNATMQIAGLVNFFNVPMVIPSADGNSLVPTDNLWAFRLSAPSSAYASYLFTKILSQTNLGITDSTAVVAPLKLSIAILYEQNTFGESAAVATAQAAMAQGIAIADYANFPSDSPSVQQLTTLADAARDQTPTLIYLISSDPTTAASLVGTLQTSYAAKNASMPILLAQAGAFTSQSFLEASQAEGIYVLRQRWVKTNCPASLTSYYAAQSYGAAYLLNYAASATSQMLTAGQKWYTRTSTADELTKFRQTLRDQLKATNLNVPCIGNVAFDASGQNKSLDFEILTVKNGTPTIVTPSDFLKIVVNQMMEMSALSQ